MSFWLEIEPIPERPPQQGTTRREIERAAWRSIVHKRLGHNISISYNRNGAPVIGIKNPTETLPAPPSSPPEALPAHTETSPPFGYISVSHTKGWVAVLYSLTPCAVDIELKTRPVSPSLAKRFAINSIADWCRLEALYKYKGLTDTDASPDSVRFINHPELVIAAII